VITVCRRDTGEKITDKLENIDFDKLLEDYDSNLRKSYEEYLKNSIVDAKSFEELKEVISQGKIARIEFCGREECANIIKEKLHAETRGTLYFKREIPKGNCIVCGEKAREITYVGKTY
jgi:hypothetical protein